MEDIAPKEWNNIPIPVSEAFVTLLNSCKNVYENINDHERNLTELLQIDQSMNLNFLQAGTEELRKRTQERISLLNSKIEVDIVDAKKACYVNDEKLKHYLITEIETRCHEMIVKSSARFTTQMDEKSRIMRREMENTIAGKVEQCCNERLAVPELVGQGMPYSTMSNFLI